MTVLTVINTHELFAAPVQIYPVQSIYATSSEFSLPVNGQNVPVTHTRGCETAQPAMGSGTASVTVHKLNNTTIGAYSITPLSLGIAGAIRGSSLSFSLSRPRYLIIKIDGRPQLVLTVDPLETSAPPPSGTGIFNVTAAPYSAQPSTTAYATAPFQNALNDAAAWRSASGGQGTVYGRGTIDGNGKASLPPSNLGAIMPTRSSDLQFTNLKIFNQFDMGENDGIDVMESTGVAVGNAVGIGPATRGRWTT
jgi:hypothetical protein